MAIDIIVQRPPGNRQGPDIIDPLLSTIPAAVARGRAEINANSGLQEVEMEVRFRSGLRLGQLVEVQDSLLNRTWRGKITGIRHVSTGGTVTTQLTVLKPSTFVIK